MANAQAVSATFYGLKVKQKALLQRPPSQPGLQRLFVDLKLSERPGRVGNVLRVADGQEALLQRPLSQPGDQRFVLECGEVWRTPRPCW